MKLDTTQVMASLEAIEYQGRRSKMFAEITFFFQEIIDYRDSLIEKGTDNKEIARLVREKTHDVIEGLAVIIKKYTRIRYDFRLYSGSLSLAFYTLYSPDVSIDPTGSTKVDPKRDDTIIKRLEAFKKGVDSRTGKLPEVIDTSIVSDKAVMGLCIDSMFLAKMYHVNLEELSAPELAYLVTHEIGHALMWGFNADVLYRRLDDLTRPIIINVKSHSDITPLVRQCRDAIKTLDTVKAKDVKPSELDKIIAKALDTLEALSKDTTQVARVNKVAIWFLGLVFSMIQSTIGSLFSFHLLRQVSMTTLRATVSNKKSKIKDSDFMFNILDIENIEFMCDEYAAMHGGGGFGVSGLEKIERMAEVGLHKKLSNNPSSKLSSLVGVDTLRSLRRIGNWNPEVRKHGELYDRYQHMASSLLKTLRADAITPEIEDVLMREYESIVASINKSKILSKHNSVEIERIKLVFSKTHSLNGLMLFLMNGKRDEHYQTIMKASEHLMNSSLVYHKKRLDRM